MCAIIGLLAVGTFWALVSHGVSVETATKWRGVYQEAAQASYARGADVAQARVDLLNVSCPPIFGPSSLWLLETLRVMVEVSDGGR